MKKRFRKITAVLLVIVMMVLMIPYVTISVSAANTADSLVAIAEGELGNTNYSKYYGGNAGAWCADFVTWCAQQAGVTSIAYSSSCYNMYIGMTVNNHCKEVSSPQKGDIVFFVCDSCSGTANIWCHVGIMVNSTTSIDGNYGGAVSYDNSYSHKGSLGYKHSSGIRKIYVRPNYDNEPEKHWYDDYTPVDLGTDFYAKITTSNNHRDVCNSEGNVNLYESCDDSNHVWYFIRQWDGSYKMKNAFGDNNFLDVYESLDENTNVQVWYDNASDGQYWFIYTKDGSNFFLRPRCSDRVLDVYGGDNNIGDNIGIWTFNESAAQSFKISKVPFPYTTIGSDFYAKIITSRNGLELTATNGNVDIRNKSDSPNHVWHFMLQTDNTYKIVNMGDNVLDADGNVNDNVNVQMWSDNGMDSQRWYIYNNGNGYYYLKPKCADRVMDVTQGLFDDGTNVGVFLYNGQDNQRFVIQKTLYPFEDIGTDFYAKISTVKNDMDVIANGGNVEIAEKTNESNHIWFFHRKDDGSYKLKNLQDSNNYMDVFNSEDDNVNVDIWYNNEGINQDWYIYKSQDGNYLIKTKASCRFLDVTGGDNNAGDNVGIWTLTQSGAQIFKIEKLKNGDTNLDGTVSIKDVTAIQRHLADLERFTEEQLALADANGDGKVDINDATHLQMYLAEYDVKLG